MKISGTRQPAVLAVIVVDREAADLDRMRRVDNRRSCRGVPQSSAIAVLKILNTEPIS